MTNTAPVNTDNSTRPQHAPTIEYDAAGNPTVYYPAAQIPFAFGSTMPAETIVGFQISYSATSVEVAAKFSLGSIFSVSGSFGEKAIFFDAVATTDYYAEATSPKGKALYGLRHGIGARLALRARNLSVETNLSYAGIAAQAKYSNTDVKYEVQAIGMPRDLLKKMLGAVPTSGSLSENSYVQIDHVLRVDLPTFLEGNQPLTIGEYVVTPQDESAALFTGVTHGVNFAMMQIARGRSLADALKTLDGANLPIDRFIVQYTYGKQTGTTDPTSTKAPSGDVRTAAKRWLDV